MTEIEREIKNQEFLNLYKQLDEISKAKVNGFVSALKMKNEEQAS